MSKTNAFGLIQSFFSERAKKKNSISPQEVDPQIFIEKTDFYLGLARRLAGYIELLENHGIEEVTVRDWFDRNVTKGTIDIDELDKKDRALINKLRDWPIINYFLKEGKKSRFGEPRSINQNAEMATVEKHWRDLLLFLDTELEMVGLSNPETWSGLVILADIDTVLFTEDFVCALDPAVAL